jgi:hypothetical protein
MRRLFRIGESWRPEGNNRSFLEYLKRMRELPGFGFRVAAFVLIAAGGYQQFGVVRGIEILGALVGAVLVIGFVVWRIRFSR